MSDYCVTINGMVWEYVPRYEGDNEPWVQECSKHRSAQFRALSLLSPTDLRAIADVMDRWAQDHAPKMRRRVVRLGAKYYARHETLPGWVYGWNQHQAREFARTQKECYPVMATDANIDALLSLREQPDEEVPSDG
jgi:hypothetical protein